VEVTAVTIDDLPDTGEWPADRGRHSTLVAQFGEARAGLAGWALTTADPLADAVVEEIHAHAHGRVVRDALRQGIADGLHTLTDAPPAVAALLTQAESIPDYVDDDLLDRASLPWFTAPTPVHAVSLSAGALVRVYQSPSIAKVLSTTGPLIDAAPRRIAETGRWTSTAMLPGSMRRGAPGYVATLQVRMLHAHSRRLARKRGYDERAYGAPINQIDLARTWMDFTVTSYRAEEIMGFGYRSVELASLYRYWWYVAHVLGLDARLVEGIIDNDQAKRVDDLLESVTGPLAPESAQLAEATLASVAGMLHEALPIPESAGKQVLYALTRRFQGNAICDELGLPRAGAAEAMLSPAIAAVRNRRLKQRRDSAAWDAHQQKNLAATQAQNQQKADETAYEHATTG
jgi:hypothetical protein